MASEPPSGGRSIRSFVLRQGRITPSQQHAFEQNWPRYGLELERGVCDWRGLFPTANRRVLEIGFGMGDCLLEMAAAAPQTAYVGIEVHRPGVGRLLAQLGRKNLHNVRIYCADAVEVITRCIAPASLDEVLLFFPDPWPKKRHHKRRLVQPALVGAVSERLTPGGRFHLATDWAPYAEHMMSVLSDCPTLINCHGQGRYCPPPPPRPHTKFERRGHRLGHQVRDLVFARVQSAGPAA